MRERIPESYGLVVIAVVTAAAALMVWALLFATPASGWIRLALAAPGFLLLRLLWTSSRRKRELSGRGFHVGRRVGTHWVYEELHGGEVVSLELELGYVGRGEYEIHIPSERAWRDTMPEWARERRGEIVDRLGTVFRRSDMRMHDD